MSYVDWASCSWFYGTSCLKFVNYITAEEKMLNIQKLDTVLTKGDEIKNGNEIQHQFCPYNWLLISDLSLLLRKTSSKVSEHALGTARMFLVLTSQKCRNSKFDWRRQFATQISSSSSEAMSKTRSKDVQTSCCRKFQSSHTRVQVEFRKKFGAF